MYKHQNRQNTASSAISRVSSRSDESYSSQSTTATSVYDDPGQPPLTRQLRHTSTSRHCTVTYGTSYSSRNSCGSSKLSGAQVFEEPEEYDEDEYFCPSFTNPSYPPPYEAIPTTPEDFATYFPSQRRLTIAHDPSAADRAMNLVISTEILEGTRKIHMQLFHLRMHDILTRAFSLRRYCRDSGREVCHSIARLPTTSQHPRLQRPKIQRSMSSAFASVKRTSVKRADTWGPSKPTKSPLSPPTLVIPDRDDSGYSTNSDDEAYFSEPELDNKPALPPAQKPSSTIKLEFSNYAHVDLRRRGSGDSKHWDFEYWGHPYSWKRTTDGTAHSYHLVQQGSSHALAHIVPDVLTTAQAREETRDGAWIPRCNLWINDTSMLREGDVADVLVATGLLTLVDDAARVLGKRPAFRRQVSIPLSPVKLDLEIVRPREMMRHVFRRGSKDSSGGGGLERPGTARSMGSPLRFLSPVEAC